MTGVAAPPVRWPLVAIVTCAFVLPLPAAADPFNPLLRINEVMLSCITNRVQFIELTAIGEGQFFYTGTTLDAYDRNGTLLYQAANLVPPSLEGQPWVEGRTLLLGSPRFRLAAGILPDVELPADLDPMGGRLVLHHENPFDGSHEVIQEFSYGPSSMNPLPALGVSLVLNALGEYDPSDSPSPQKLSGAVLDIACAPFNDRLRVGELLLSCITDRVQFIELTAIGEGQFFYTGTTLDAFDRHGVRLFQTSAFVPSSLEGAPWAKGRTILLGSSFFRQATGVLPDLELPADLDPVAGRIILHHQNPFDGGMDTLQVFDYGPATPTSVPEPGQSLVLGLSGSYAPALPTPVLRSGSPVPLDCDQCPVLGCGGSLWRFNSGPWTLANVPSFSFTQGTESVTFDLPAGTSLATAGGYGGRASLQLRDVYALEGLAETDTITFKVLLTAVLGGAQWCTEHGHCSFASPDVALIHGSTVVRSTLLNGIQVLEISLRKGACETFELIQETSIRISALVFPISGSVGTRVEFAGLPQGVRVVSCRGFIQDAPTAALVSHVRSEVQASRVMLWWHTPSRVGPVTVYRRPSGAHAPDAWSVRGEILADGMGWLVFEDRDVMPGDRYDYRLGIHDGGEEQLLGDVSVEIPVASALAIRFPDGHPLGRNGEIELIFPTPDPGTLTVFDVGGRRVGSRIVSADGSGRARLRLDTIGVLAAGLYIAEVRQGEARTTRRVLYVP